MPIATLGQVLYPMHYNWLLSDEWNGLVLQSVRIVLLIAASGWGFWRLLRAGDRMPEVGIDTVEKVRQTA
jgi:hypothetical protein